MQKAVRHLRDITEKATDTHFNQHIADIAFYYNYPLTETVSDNCHIYKWVNAQSNWQLRQQQ